MLRDLSPRPGDLDPIETASRDEIAALQRRRMAETLCHAYAYVPHYRRAFVAAGVHPDDFRDLPDLHRFPFTTKADLRANYPFGMFAVPREQVARIHASSGTTGKPTVVGYTQADLDVWAEVMARSMTPEPPWTTSDQAADIKPPSAASRRGAAGRARCSRTAP